MTGRCYTQLVVRRREERSDAHRRGAACPLLEGKRADHQLAPAGGAECLRGEGSADLDGEEVVGGQPFAGDDGPLWTDEGGHRGERQPDRVPWGWFARRRAGQWADIAGSAEGEVRLRCT